MISHGQSRKASDQPEAPAAFPTVPPSVAFAPWKQGCEDGSPEWEWPRNWSESIGGFTESEGGAWDTPLVTHPDELAMIHRWMINSKGIQCDLAWRLPGAANPPPMAAGPPYMRPRLVGFHGTSSQSIEAITDHGFRTPLKRGMLGRRIYLSPDCSKSAPFSHSKGSDRMLVCHFDPGLMCVYDKREGWVEGEEDTIKAIPPFVRSTPAEYAVRDPARVTPAYIIQFSTPSSRKPPQPPPPAPPAPAAQPTQPLGPFVPPPLYPAPPAAGGPPPPMAPSAPPRRPSLPPYVPPPPYAGPTPPTPADPPVPTAAVTPPPSVVRHIDPRFSYRTAPLVPLPPLPVAPRDPKPGNCVLRLLSGVGLVWVVYLIVASSICLDRGHCDAARCWHTFGEGGCSVVAKRPYRPFLCPCERKEPGERVSEQKVLDGSFVMRLDLSQGGEGCPNHDKEFKCTVDLGAWPSGTGTVSATLGREGDLTMLWVLIPMVGLLLLCCICFCCPSWLEGPSQPPL